MGKKDSSQITYLAHSIKNTMLIICNNYLLYYIFQKKIITQLVLDIISFKQS